MQLMKMFDRCTKSMKWYDFSMLKLSVFFFTLFLLTAWSGFRDLVLGISWVVYLALAVVVSVPLLVKLMPPKRK